MSVQAFPHNGIALAVHDLSVRFPIRRDWLGRPVSHAHALQKVSLSLRQGETLCVVGESGCGKSTLAQVLAGLVTPTEGRVERPDGGLQMVFQDPTSSLDPRLPVWRVITEPVFLRCAETPQALRALAADLAVQVGLRPEHVDRFPHEFSGGQRQRIAIARALSAEPSVMVLDEPTSALDISVQAQILNLLMALQRQRSLSYVFITHDVSVVEHIADRVAVMYLGQVVELASRQALFAQPRHPYTRLLLDAVPRVGQASVDTATVDAEMPSNRRLPSGCFFQSRCPAARPGCERPQALQSLPGGAHAVRCHLAFEPTTCTTP